MNRREIRSQLVDNLNKRLLGPRDGPEESFEELPIDSTRGYIIGVLFPPETTIGPQQELNDIPEGSEEDEEPINITKTSSLVKAYRPSSIGLSFIIDEDANKIPVEINWATYSQEIEHGPFTRHEHNIKIDVDLSRNDVKSIYDQKDLEKKEFYLEWKFFKKIKSKVPERQKDRIVSLFLVNKEKSSKKKAEISKGCIFSPVISVRLEKRFILARERTLLGTLDSDLESLNLLYHNRHEFGTGHGCSVEWDDIEKNRCGILRTTFLPKYLWNPIVFERKDAFSVANLPMKELSDFKKNKEIISKLKNIVHIYENWINHTFSVDERNKFEPTLQNAFDRHKIECLDSLNQINEGIELLNNDLVFKAFCFMNESMFRQRVYTNAANEHRKHPENGFKNPDLTNEKLINDHKWYTFQLAFILKTIPGIVDPKKYFDNREIVDLLWVPTGGGKTEAYFGLAVFIIAYRRLMAKERGLKIEDYAGISVMMRYTLRLLTIQQFQRATSLMCACEEIRQTQKHIWGEAPFLVGLFVGQSTTPNSIGNKDDYQKYETDNKKYYNLSNTAYYALEYWKRKREKPADNNPFQLMYCPWCGEELGADCYQIDKENQFLITHCARNGCTFNKVEIPAITVDQNIFRRLPSMIIGTVDKFAMLPFNPRIGMLFGHADKYCPKHGFYCKIDDHPSHRDGITIHNLTKSLFPPDLIIQDELHLINGPLGSLVGIYETTVEILSTRKIGDIDLKPKIIASTATIRRAREQVWNLFGRNIKRFPSPGTQFTDSFFIQEIEDFEKAKLFVGFFPSGIGHKTVLKRTMSSVILDIKEIKNRGIPKEEWDDYWTVVSYFNSIRELGSAKTTIEDDIQNEVKSKRDILPIYELTSRMDSKDLPDILSKLNISGDNENSIDILACSNMFSVGVDVQRLGLMFMNNQPKSTSEYIQSTGRVGRNGTGLVLVLYNWGRPRDQSHFEQFFDYHNRIQSHVEAMTVTPFSEGARQRALHAQYVSLMRIQTTKNLSRNSEAGYFDSTIRESQHSRDIQKMIKHRMETVTNEESTMLESELSNFLDEWINTSESGQLSYERDRYRRGGNYLLRKIDDPDEPNEGGPRVLTLTSMRNVERQVVLHKLMKLPR